MKKTRKPGGGRKKLKPEYDAGKNLKEQMESAVALYDSEMSLQAIGDELGLNPIKVRKLLITAGVYESEVAEKVQCHGPRKVRIQCPIEKEVSQA